MEQNDLLKDIEKRTGVRMDQIMGLVNSLQNADLSDERTARNLVKQVGQMANKPVSREKEDRLVKAIMNKNIPNSLSIISQMLGGK